MTPEDKARIEEIRKSWINGVEPVPFLLAQLDETSTRLASAHAALREAKAAMVQYEMDVDDLPTRNHTALMVRIDKALDGSTDPDTGTKGSLGEE